jgi:hypothetical protein
MLHLKYPMLQVSCLHTFVKVSDFDKGMGVKLFLFYLCLVIKTPYFHYSVLIKLFCSVNLLIKHKFQKLKRIKNPNFLSLHKSCSNWVRDRRWLPK